VAEGWAPVPDNFGVTMVHEMTPSKAGAANDAGGFG
jgi:hypothetical protein